MPRQRRQNGWVKTTGKSPRTWTGFWYAYETIDGKEYRHQKSRVLGLRSELTKGDAEEKLRDLIRAQLMAGGAMPPTVAVPTFDIAARNYLELKKGDWGPKMRSCIGSIFNRHIIPALGAKQVGNLKASDIKAFLNNLADTGSESLLRKTITHLRGMFELLIEDEVIRNNPAKVVTKPKTRKPNERYLQLGECRRLISAAQGRDQIILWILLSCPFRPSEVFALRVQDVVSGRLRIDEAAVPGLKVKETKTEESDGYVPISQTLEQQLRDYIRECRLMDPRDLLFPSAVGTPMRS